MTADDRKSTSPAAERMRLYRKRRRQGLHHVRIQLHVTDVDGLIRTGFLKEEERDDPERLQAAVLGLVYWVVEDRELSAAIRRQIQARSRGFREHFGTGAR